MKRGRYKFLMIVLYYVFPKLMLWFEKECQAVLLDRINRDPEFRRSMLYANHMKRTTPQ